MFDLRSVQAALEELGIDGWLLYDFRGANMPARRVLGLDARPVTSRRFFYFIPTSGEPRKLVHKIEPAALDSLTGAATVYLSWQELEAGVGALLAGSGRVAMEYSERAGNPYVGKVDAGTIELVKSFGVEVVSSGDLIGRFESLWDDDQWAMHLEADAVTRAGFDVAWGLIADRVRAGGTVREVEVQAAILDHFARNGLTTYSPPIVGVGPHSGDPHYEPVAGRDAEIGAGSFVLIDLWAKVDRPRSVYSDLTRVGYVGETVPAIYAEVFGVVASARDAAIALIRGRFGAGLPLKGFEVDRAAREVITRAGYGDQFIHRTGHNIGQEIHGSGAHMDDLETRDDRLVLPRTCFSIEPGIYRDDFGIRSEVNVYIGADRSVHVTGGQQTEVLAVLA